MIGEPGPSQTTEGRLAAMTDEEVVGWCKEWQAARERYTNPYSRWWCSKEISRGRRELMSRGLDPYAWETETAADDDSSAPASDWVQQERTVSLKVVEGDGEV